MMAEGSRGKRRKQANPRRNQGEVEGVLSLGSEGEDEAGGWILEPPDRLDQTPSTEGTEAGSPACSAQNHSLNLGLSPTAHWAEGARAGACLNGTEREKGSFTMFNHSPDSQSSDNVAHYDFLVQLRTASSPARLLGPRLHTGSSTPTSMLHPGGRHRHREQVHLWSARAQHSPEGADLSPEGSRTQQLCPFCQRSYQHGALLREHMQFCPEREGPQGDYTASYRTQVEMHMPLHSPSQDKPHVTDHLTESRKFKCLQCGKAFKYKHHLKEHLRIHSGEKPYECSNCKKRFSHSGSYSSHLSSKKCLNGPGGGGGGEVSNGQPIFRSSPTLPSAGGRRNSGGGSPYGTQPQDRAQRLGLGENLSPLDLGSSRAPGRVWDPNGEFSLLGSGFQGSSLLPYLHSGPRFQQALQAILQREVEEVGGGQFRPEEATAIHNGEHEDKASPDRSARQHEGAELGEVGGVTCEGCSQLFPSAAVLLQHQRYLCRTSRPSAEMPEGPRGKDRLSFPRPPDLHHPPAIPNLLPRDSSPLPRHGWHSLPQQLLVALQPRPEPLALRSYWPSQENGGPGQPISPVLMEMSSPGRLKRGRICSSGFGSSACLDLSPGPSPLSPPPGRAASQNRAPWWAGTSGPTGSQNEPLDLSLPRERGRACNGHPAPGETGESRDGGERRERGGRESRERDERGERLQDQHPNTPPPHPSHPHPTHSGATMLGGSVFSSYHPLFPPLLQAGLGGAGQDTGPSLALRRPRLLPHLPFLRDSEIDAVIQKMQQERQGAEVVGRGGLDFLSGGEVGEGGRTRRRLRKTEEGLYACNICDKTFQKSSSLLRHKYEHTGKRPHECAICQKAFKHKHHLIEHRRLHSGEKPYRCDRCGKRFSHSGSYSQHMNHRYAYCSRDNDPDLDFEDPPLTPGAEPRSLGEGTPTPNATPTFLSDCSLDEHGGGLEEEEEEE
ncbi:zinc finger E-box-binding homeobox 2-like, partial [Hypomesus transpacificus]|uniref:zinc finger E-box-binding homeobox 2-like n=1 Tax=Hypomesus transpacificus TaxID=137520 RepID=UPI001F079D52